MKRIAVYPGTFDPITNGHVGIIKRALKLFDRVIIAVAGSSRKSPCIELQRRIQLVKEVFADERRLEVLSLVGLTVDFAKQHGAQFICRGLRATSDFDYEFQLSGMNYQLAPEIETVFLSSAPNEAIISSTFVREIVALQGDVSKFVPPKVAEFLKEKINGA